MSRRESGTASSVDAREVAAFDAKAGAWWDATGVHAPLHRLNPARLGYIRDRIAAHRGRDSLGPQPLAGVRVIDIGCGGGLVTEPMARLGAVVRGIDAGAAAIAVARDHAAGQDLAIDYRVATVEDTAAEGGRFDVVLALEIVEHVADVGAFLAAACAIAADGGLIILSTLNRTWKSYALAIVGAERILRWVPPGTHDWSRFPAPAEIARHLRGHGARVTDVSGLVYDPVRNRWSIGRDTAVNYLLTAAVMRGR
ncbi:MAG: bifunctional 2-polyprenyl-6-hydroxyphenol methylase/3-demethylubiquinol 3-O-methyltransferase UbiG [Alphaproteobacteria bacterium]|nr:bifunctional 2-polyprenyl-6-hydroxyphenol methylase/3-demethylubiquinol 3-O-methyltransferase UbiG [Alphaproteobacteria bacterium]